VLVITGNAAVRYLVISSTLAIKVSGISRPSALTLLKFKTVSYFGSAGLAPCRMQST
jgi:hypothetical protein